MFDYSRYFLFYLWYVSNRQKVDHFRSEKKRSEYET